MRLEDIWPTGSVCFRFEVKFHGLKSVMVVDAVGERTSTARFDLTNDIHLVEVMQVGCYEASVCQLHFPSVRPRRLTISPFPVLAKLLHTLSLDES